MTSGRDAMAIARSISSSGVTQTGQPGPWTRRTSSGSSSSIPNLRMEWVCPPQTSMSVQGRVTVSRIRRTTASTAAGSRYSSTWRITVSPSVSSRAPISARAASVSCAACSSIREMAKPTWTRT